MVSIGYTLLYPVPRPHIHSLRTIHLEMVVVLLVIRRRRPRSSLLISNTIVSRLRLVLELVHRRNGHHIAAHNVLAHVPGQFLRVVLGVVAVADVEHGVELFEREGFGLGQQEVAVHPAEQVPAGVPTERAGGSEGGAEGGPGEGDDEVEAPAGGGGERHAWVYVSERSSIEAWRLKTYRCHGCRAGMPQRSR